MRKGARTAEVQRERLSSTAGRRFKATLVGLAAATLGLAMGAAPAFAEGASFWFGPEGEGSGQVGIYGSSGMAIDPATGDIYLSDVYNNRIEKWDASGNFISAWGWGVADGASEFQTCTTSCTRGPETAQGAGAVSYPEGVAIDPATSDVYVVDFGNHRVDKFDSAGKFLLMFGGHVNKGGANVCTAAEASECQTGTEGPGDSEFSEAYLRAYIAVGPGGAVYVGDKARVQVFEPSGAWKENISLASLSSEGKVAALAVNAVGDVFVKDEGVPGIHEFEPPLYTEAPTQLDEGSEIVEAITLNSSGDLFVAESMLFPYSSEPCTCDFKEYSPSGQQLETFGGSTLMHMKSGMVLDEALKELLIYGTDAEYNVSEYGHLGIWAFTMPAPGPLVEPGSERATPELRGAATLEATVDPEGSETTAHFEYVDEAHFLESGYAAASSTEVVVLKESGFGNEHVEIKLPQKTLVPGVTYHWRIVASNSAGTIDGSDQILEEIPPAYVEGPWATHVSATGATLSANINPLGASTSYRLEYGKTTSYEHAIAGSVGEGMAFVEVDHHVQELEPGAVYHYRLVTESEVGVVTGGDHTIMTQAASGALVLPDGRAWELVSPANKGGALIEDTERSVAAADGTRIIYAPSEPIGEGIAGHVGNNAEAIAGATVLSRHGQNGWVTGDISPIQTLPPEGTSDVGGLNGGAEAFTAFTADLSLAAVEPQGINPLLSKEATEQTVYVRNNASETYQPVVDAANALEGAKWGEGSEMNFQAASPDLKHILISDWAALTPGATTVTGGFTGYQTNLYEWTDGQLQQVNILPNEEPKPGAAFGSGSEGRGGFQNPWAMSADGRWVVFRYNQGYTGPWYVRDMVAHKTVQFGSGPAGAMFQTMSRDGSRLFYIVPEGRGEEGELYLFDPATGTTSSLTANHIGGATGQVQNMLVGSSEDGTYLYFVARGVLASGATRGQDNLYVLHFDGSEWHTTFIATLSSDDEKDWHTNRSELVNITSHVTPSGRLLTFMSDRPLTGYDNHDARTGVADEEVFLYNATTGHLVCASCNPTGARPVGVYDGGTFDRVEMDQNGAWAGHWLAADISPDWHTAWYHAVSRPPYLTESGRLFFNSSDALVPQDTNGVADVYEYEPIGVGTCTNASATYNEGSAGCVDLISSGQSAGESTYLDSSESGDDAFFITAAKLVGADYDTANDVYDAHVCTQALPCRPEPVMEPECTSGDSCKAAPSPQPELFGAEASETFNGAGNVAPPTGIKPSSSRPRCGNGRTRRAGRCVKRRHKKRKRHKRARRGTTGTAIRRGHR